MTFKLTKTKLFGALIVALCTLAVAFAVVLFMPRGVALADEPAADDTYTVTWEYKADAQAVEWQSFVNGKTLFTYEQGKDYSALVRAKIDLGSDITPEYVSYAAADADTYLSYSGTFEGNTVNTLVNATEYTVTINGDFGVSIADADRTIKIKIAPRVFDLRSSDFIDYYGAGESNRLWLLEESSGGGSATYSELGDLATYYDPQAEFNSEYGAKVTTGVLYNAYARYTGKPQSIVLNDDYKINNVAFKDYKPAIKSIEYDNKTSTGLVNTVNKITTTATITLGANWALDSGTGNTIVLTKEWYIVTINNALRALDGSENTSVAGWMFGSAAPALSIRPEHGDTAVFTLTNESNVLARFAIRYSGKGEETVLTYYDVKSGDNGYVVDTEKELDDGYCAEQFAALEVGAYALNVAVPSYTSTDDHEHWWENAEDESSSIVYYPISRTYHFTVGCYEATNDTVGIVGAEGEAKEIMIEIVNDHVTYNALENNVPEVIVTFRGVALEAGEDYELQSNNIKVGKASFVFVGKGNFMGSVPFGDMYYIDQAVNSWKEVPSIMYWTYSNYDKQMNLINAVPTYLDNPNDLWFKITTDRDGEIPATTALTSFRLTDGIVSDDVAKSLSTLSVGTYYLFATVEGSTNYKALAPRGVAFKVFKDANRWEVAPKIDTWAEGSYNADNVPVYKVLHGTATIVIKDSKNNVVYSTVTGVNKLSSATAGVYTLTATVVGSNDYDGIEYTMTFTVYEKRGVPAWTIWLIVLGTLLLVALVIFILIKTKVLRILTDKIMVEIRTKATVDATIASIRASKKNDEQKARAAKAKEEALAEAKKQEQKAARREKAEKERSLTTDQRIAALEEKASKTAARAEKMRQRAEVMQKRAERLRGAAEAEQQPAPEPTAEPVAEAAATETPETTTEN